ncbi:MAG: nuclear transport factor 2 family protein [Bacteroidota bacterium]
MTITKKMAEPLADEQKILLAQTFVTALKNNDWELMASIMLEDISWTLPGSSLLSGPAYGVQAVISRAKSLKNFGVMFNLKHILLSLDGFALALHNTATRGELLLDEQVVIVFKLDGDKLYGMTTYLSDVAGIEAFFIPGIIA